MTEHPHDALQELLSGRLSESEAAPVRAHLEVCVPCQDFRASLEHMRATLRGLPAEPVPEDVRRRVLAALDAEDRMGTPRGERSRAPAWLRWMPTFSLALAAVVLLITVPLLRQHRTTAPLVRETAAEFRDYQKGASPLGVSSADPGAVNAYFAKSDLPFSPRVPELQGAGCTLEGACVRQAEGKPRAVVAYRDEAGHSLLCSAFEGDVKLLTRGASTFVRNGKTFYVHEVDGVTLVCWQDGPLTNLVASDMSREALLAVAQKEAGG